MPRYLTQARVTKPAALRRESSLPFAGVRRMKSTSQQQILAKALDDASDDEEGGFGMAAATGEIVTTFNATVVADVVSAMQYTTRSMFSALPDRAGMNSVRIAEVLNYQKNLPPIVSVPHIHAIISASSKNEREIQALLSRADLLKLRVTGRGNDVSGLSEVLILMSDYRRLLAESGLSAETVSLFIDAVSQTPRASSISSRLIPPSTATLLIRAGFLVSSSFLGSRNLSLSGSSTTGVPVISRAASGTSAAVGGDAAFETLGGVGVGQRSKSVPNLAEVSSELVLSVPNIGLYLRLLEAGRRRLLELLRSSKHRQAPLYLLRERWDGAIDSESQVSQAKRLRGEFSLVLPAKTKKWKELKGLNFEWALEECLGAGMIELFETHSVGLGVRALG